LANQPSLRKNLIHLAAENWKPPIYYPHPNFWIQLKNAGYRFLDLQAGTIWDDLSVELPKVQGTVLDVGCGLQPYRFMFSKEVRYLGIDTIDSKAHFGYETPDTRYYSGDIWPLKNQSVNFILCTETLEHVPEPLVFLKEAFRCLKPGGKLLLTVPFAVRWHFIPYDYWRYTPSGLNRLLTQSGFERPEVFARGNELTVACYKIMAFIFTLLFPTDSSRTPRWLQRFLGFLFLPLLFLMAVLANFSKGIDGTVDCLGYTVLAMRPSRQFPPRGFKKKR